MSCDLNSKPSVILSLHEVSVIRNGEAILDAVSLDVSAGEIVTLIGPNGSGKSTLVKVALGLISADRGRVQRSSKLRMAYVPQSMEIDQSLPINVIRFMRLYRDADRASIDTALRKTGAQNLRDASLHTLSGGEMRRVLLARAIISKPQLLVLDEPTAGVDISGQAALYALIHSLRDEIGCGILLVSHDLHIVMAATDQVICLNRHLCCSGTPESVRQSPEFAHLFGKELAPELAVYHHHHDHQHGLHGDVCNHTGSNMPGSCDHG
jgi:zinc transport system ATP-binding protein